MDRRCFACIDRGMRTEQSLEIGEENDNFVNSMSPDEKAMGGNRLDVRVKAA